MYAVMRNHNEYLQHVEAGTPVWTRWEKQAWRTPDRWVAVQIALGIGHVIYITEELPIAEPAAEEEHACSVVSVKKVKV